MRITGMTIWRALVLGLLLIAVLMQSSKADITAGHLPATQSGENQAQTCQPAPQLILPLHGEYFRGKSKEITFIWVDPTGNQGSYLLQVADNKKLENPRISKTLQVSYHMTVMPAGEWFWRVRTDGPKGAHPWSSTHSFTITKEATSPLVAGKDLGIKPAIQKKDTKMVCLGCEADGAHAWNSPHDDEGSQQCRHCKHYCGRTCAMILNRHFGGDLSQDMISFELFKGRSDRDGVGKLGHGEGFGGTEMITALQFALKTDKGQPVEITPEAYSFRKVVDHINAGRPLVGAIPPEGGNPAHLVVIDGYEDYELDSEDTLHVLQPYTGQEELVVKTSIRFILPVPARCKGVKKGPEPLKDPDKDRLVTFDEVERFSSRPDKNDSDEDLIPDGVELRGYRFGRGWGNRYPTLDGWLIWRQRDYDGDKRDDGKEDANHNGTMFKEGLERGESDPYVKERPIKVILDLAGAQQKDGLYLDINGKRAGVFPPTGKAAGYHQRETSFFWAGFLEPIKTQKIRLTTAGFDDVQIRNIRVIDETAENSKPFESPAVLHLGYDRLEKIKKAIEAGRWTDPNGLEFWKELDGDAVELTFFWRGYWRRD